MQFYRISAQYVVKALFDLYINVVVAVPAGGTAVAPTVPVGLTGYFRNAQPVAVVGGAAPGDDTTMRPFSKTVEVGAVPIVRVVCLGTFKLTLSSS